MVLEEYKLKEKIKIVGINPNFRDDSSRKKIRKNTPYEWLESLGRYLKFELPLYEGYEILTLEYSFSSSLGPYIHYRDLARFVLKKLGIEKYSESDLSHIRKELLKLPYDIVVICRWPYELLDGTFYEENLRTFKGNGGIIPACCVENEEETVNCGTHEIIEFYFGEVIHLGKEYCRNPSCCMYYDESILSHVIRNGQRGLCEACKRKLYHEWIPSLKKEFYKK